MRSRQFIGGGSFGAVGPKKPTYYYDLDPADEYAIAAVRGKSFFKLASDGFEGADLFDGEKFAVDLPFVAKRDTKRLDEFGLRSGVTTGSSTSTSADQRHDWRLLAAPCTNDATGTISHPAMRRGHPSMGGYAL